MQSKPKVLLIIIDGWGIEKHSKYNAISVANTPNMDYLCSKPKYSAKLSASGLNVGLPSGVMGNSEVGHLTIGAGSILKTDIVRINESIEKDILKENKELNSIFNSTRETNKQNKERRIHLVGMCSNASVHSHINHLFALMDIFISRNSKEKEFKEILLHLITDGRDTPPNSSLSFIKEVFDKIDGINGNKEKGNSVKVASLGGRFFYMDRDNRNERTAKAFSTMLGKGLGFSLSEKYSSEQLTDLQLIERYIEGSYEKKQTDEFLEPVLVSKDRFVRDSDVLVFFNFRADRMRQLVSFFLNPSKLYSEEQFTNCTNSEKEPKFEILTMTSYDSSFLTSTSDNDDNDRNDTNTKKKSKSTLKVLFPTLYIENPLSKVLSQNSIKQTHIAETEKYAHVTYFFNGRIEEPFPLENRILVPSNKNVKTYDLAPKMSMKEVTDKTIETIKENSKSEEKHFVVINFAAPDMVGHTGNLEAAIKACEFCDEEIGRLREVCKAQKWVLMITADHGNAEKMFDEQKQEKITFHTCSEVPFVVEGLENVSSDYVGDGGENKEICFGREKGELADVAPTILKVMGISGKTGMGGRSFL